MVFLGSSQFVQRAQKIYPELLSRESFLCSQKHLNHIHAWAALENKCPGVALWAMPRGAQMGWSVGCWQILAPVSWYISFSLPKFPLIFFWLFLYGIFMIFSCNVYEAFLYVFSSKTNVKNTPPLPALLDFCACWMQVSHMNTSVCVKLIHCCVTVHACWTFSYSYRSLASKSHPHSSGGPPPALLNPVMASAWCGCSPGLKGELQSSHLPLPQSRGWSVLRGPGAGPGAGCVKTRGQKAEGIIQTDLPQEIIPR